MTKSLSDNTGSVWWVVCNILYFTAAIERPGYHIYMFPAVNYFPDLSHINIQGVKTHTVGNQAMTPALKHVHVDY